MVNITTLDNGVRIISQLAEQMHTVSIGFWVANATRQELPEQNGIAHFMEHLLFKGTNRRTARQISLEMDSMGGILNAFTSHEYVCFYAKVLAKFLPRTTDLLTDIFIHSNFPADEIERERKVILQEIKMRDDSPDESITDRFHEHFWHGHTLGKCILGSDQIITSLSRESLIEYKNSHYRPEDIIIVAAGNVDHNELVNLLSEQFSKVSSKWKPKAEKELQPTGRQLNLCERDLEQTLICLGTKALPQNDPDRHAMHLLTTILGGGMSSRLFQEIREKRGLAYSVYCYSQSHHDSGAMVIYAGTEEKHCRELLDITLNEIHRIKKEPVPVNELDSAREQIKGKLLMSLESSESLMTRLAKSIIYQGENQPIATILDKFDAVTSDDVLKIAVKLFDNECINLELLGKTSNTGISLENVNF